MEITGHKKSLENSRNETVDFLLNVIANDDGGIHGNIQHNESGETTYFRSLIEMILLINGKLDQLNFLQPTNKIRTWNVHNNPLCLKGGRVLWMKQKEHQ